MKAVVLVHGIPGSSAVWNAVVTQLDPLRVVVPDLLGFGSAPRPSDLLAPAQAEALEGSLAAAGIDRAVVVGHDFGGAVALSLYRRRPALFDALMLMATNVFPDTPIPFPLSAVTWPVAGPAMARVVFGSPALRLMLTRYGGRELGDPRSVRRIFAGSLRDLDRLYRDYPATLASVTVPTAIVWGDCDPFFPVAQAQRTAALASRGELTVLRGAGHFLPEQRPGAVADAIRVLARRSVDA